MRILFYGAGVIGSLYAALLSEAGLDITVYARGSRLKTLEKHGLQYKKNNKVRKASVKVLSVLEQNDYYDFILLAVRGHQLLQALEELKSNCSPTIVTMVNSLDPYDKWEDICGKGRILPAFPGAGGGVDGEVLDAALTPRLIQPTTIVRIDGREKKLAEIMRKAGIPCQIVPDMHVWQICHLGMVVPIADAYYEANDPKHAGQDWRLMKKTAAATAASAQGITADQALEIALNDAGLTAGQVSYADTHLDYDDDYGMTDYDVEFHVGNKEYSYDINPATGAILNCEVDIDD